MLDFFNFCVELTNYEICCTVADSTLQLLFVDEHDLLVEHVVVSPVLVDRMHQVREHRCDVSSDHPDGGMSVVFDVLLEEGDDVSGYVLMLERDHGFLVAVIVVDKCVIHRYEMRKREPFDRSCETSVAFGPLKHLKTPSIFVYMLHMVPVTDAFLAAIQVSFGAIKEDDETSRQHLALGKMVAIACDQS